MKPRERQEGSVPSFKEEWERSLRRQRMRRCTCLTSSNKLIVNHCGKGIQFIFWHFSKGRGTVSQKAEEEKVFLFDLSLGKCLCNVNL